ncbi:MAG: hypothetical protein AAFN30_14630 [Actinomycetota bacterium]
MDGRHLIRKRPIDPGDEVESGYRRAAAAAAALETAGITARHEVVALDQGVALLIDQTDGRLMSEVLRDQLDTASRLRLVTNVAETLRRLHERLLVHGDIRPEHLLVSDDLRRVELLGLGSMRSSDPSIDLAGEAAGPGWDGAASPRDDLVALGYLIELTFGLGDTSLSSDQQDGGSSCSTADAVR